jgi:hypothetical protein
MKERKPWHVFRFKKPDQEIDPSPSSNEYIVDLVAKWADHRITTSEGRRFAFIHGSDTILYRAEALGIFLSRGERALLERGSLVGAIVEFGSIGTPMLYGDSETLKSDWLELHHSFNEPLTEEEMLAFGPNITFGGEFRSGDCNAIDENSNKNEDGGENIHGADLLGS